MKTLKIDMQHGAVLKLDEQVSGKEGTVQSALVNITTAKGSDRAFPTRGTDLLRRALLGELIDVNSAQHASNFAALDTLFFTARNTQATADEELLADIDLTPVAFSYNYLRLDASMEMQDDTVVGVVASV